MIRVRSCDEDTSNAVLELSQLQEYSRVVSMQLKRDPARAGSWIRQHPTRQSAGKSRSKNTSQFLEPSRIATRRYRRPIPTPDPRLKQWSHRGNGSRRSGALYSFGVRTCQHPDCFQDVGGGRQVTTIDRTIVSPSRSQNIPTSEGVRSITDAGSSGCLSGIVTLR